MSLCQLHYFNPTTTLFYNLDITLCILPYAHANKKSEILEWPLAHAGKQLEQFLCQENLNACMGDEEESSGIFCGAIYIWYEAGDTKNYRADTCPHY